MPTKYIKLPTGIKEELAACKYIRQGFAYVTDMRLVKFRHDTISIDERILLHAGLDPNLDTCSDFSSSSTMDCLPSQDLDSIAKKLLDDLEKEGMEGTASYVEDSNADKVEERITAFVPKGDPVYSNMHPVNRYIDERGLAFYQGICLGLKCTLRRSWKCRLSGDAAMLCLMNQEAHLRVERLQNRLQHHAYVPLLAVELNGEEDTVLSDVTESEREGNDEDKT